MSGEMPATPAELSPTQRGPPPSESVKRQLESPDYPSKKFRTDLLDSTLSAWSQVKFEGVASSGEQKCGTQIVEPQSIFGETPNVENRGDTQIVDEPQSLFGETPNLEQKRGDTQVVSKPEGNLNLATGDQVPDLDATSQNRVPISTDTQVCDELASTRGLISENQGDEMPDLIPDVEIPVQTQLSVLEMAPAQTQLSVLEGTLMPPPRMDTEQSLRGIETALVGRDPFETQAACVDVTYSTQVFHPTDPYATQAANFALPRRVDALPLGNAQRPSVTALVPSEQIALPTKRLFSRKKALPKPRRVFLFTGIPDEVKDAQCKFKALFQNDVGVSEDWGDDITHVVAAGPPLKRTLKVICGICKGLPIVSMAYIQQCVRERKLVALESSFLYEELTLARQYAKGKPLLADFRAVYIFPSIKNRIQWRPVIESAGSTLLASFPADRINGVLLIGMPSDSVVLHRRKLKAPVYSFDLLREAFVSQVCDFEKHELFR